MFKKQTVKTHMKMYKHKKLWLIMGITTATMALGTTQITVAKADTTSVTSALETSVASQTNQVALTGQSQASASQASQSSQASQGDQTSQANAGSSASQASQNSQASQGSQNSQASQASQGSQASQDSQGSQASQTSQSNQTSQASQGDQSNQGSQVSQANQNSQASQSNVGSMARGALSRQVVSTATTGTTVTTTPDPDTVVTIQDPTLRAVVKQSMGIADDTDITIGAIERYRGTLSIQVTSPYSNNDASLADQSVETLAGLENFQYLDSSVNFILQLITANTTAGINIDLSPLIPLHLTGFSLLMPYPAKTNLAPLTQMDPSRIMSVSITPSMGQYQGNQYGMTNAQLAQLGPWLTAIGNNGHVVNGNYYEPNISVINNSLTDFSPLAGITDRAFIAAEGQMTVNFDHPLNLVKGQPITFTGITLKGVQGETINNAFGYSFNTVGVGRQPITRLGNNQYQIDSVQQNPGAKNFLIYGNIGFAYSDYSGLNKDVNGDYVGISYPNGVSLITDMQVYQAANFQDHPNVTIKYVDQNVKAIAALPDQVVNGENIGDAYDLTSYTKLPGYQVVGATAKLTGTYTLDPQTIYMMAVPDIAAGAVTVNYVDTDGQVLGTANATYPRGQLLNLTYTTTPKDFDGYTLKGVDPAGLAATGLLTTAGGTVTYVYTKNPVLMGQTTINYVDDTTTTVLKTVTLTGEQTTTDAYTTAATIAAYQQAGYTLVTDAVPTEGITYGPDATTYAVHLAHQLVAVTTPAELQKTVTQTIHYVDTTGQMVADDHVANVTFTRTGQQDLVTGATTYTDWTPATQTFTAQLSPVIADYTVDQATVAAQAVTPTSADMVMTVTYTAKPVKPTPPATDDNKPTTPAETDKPTPPATDDNKPTTPAETDKPTPPVTDDNKPTTTPAETDKPTTPDTPDEQTKPTVPVTPNNQTDPTPTVTETAQGDGLVTAAKPVTPTPATVQPSASVTPTNVDTGQADTIQPTATKPVAKTATVALAPAGDRLNAQPQALNASPHVIQSTPVTPKATAKLTTVSNHAPAKLVPVVAPKMTHSATLPQTADNPTPATSWLGVGVLLTSLLTALGIKRRQH